MSEGGDYEEAQLVEQGTKEVLIPAIKGMGETLQKASQSVGAGARRVAGDVEQVDGQARDIVNQAGNGAADTAARDAGQLSGNASRAAAGGGGPAGGDGPIDDDFSGGNAGGQVSGGTGSCATGGTDPVDVVSGQMISAKVDVHLPGILPLALRRAYASGYRHGRLYGPGWSSTLDQRLVIDDEGIHFLGDDAQILNYGIPAQPGQRMLPAAGARRPLSWNRQLDAITIEDGETGVTLHFAPPSHDQREREGSAQVRHLTRITDRNDNWLSITRDTDGVPTLIDHAGGYRVEVDTSYGAGGFRIEALRLTDPEHPDGLRLVGYGYDPAGRLIEVLDGNNIPYIYEHDRLDRITAWIDRAGYRYEYQYDEAGRVVRTGGEDGALAAMITYDQQARCNRVTDSLGAVTEYWYDEHRHLTKVVDALGGVTTMQHDRYGRLLESIDPTGAATRLMRDENGDVLAVVRPDGSRITAEYNGLRRPLRTVAASGAASSYEYDERGNLTAATDASGSVVRYEYGEHGALAALVDPAGNRTTVAVNRAGLPTSVTDPLGARWLLERDARGSAVKLTDPLGAVTTTAYDAEARPTCRTFADGSRETWAYDARGGMVRHTNQAGYETAFEYGPFLGVLSRTDPDGSRYEFAQDSELRLTRVTNPQQSNWTYEYDAAGGLQAETDFNGRRLAYEYDAAGRVVRRTNGAGQIVDYLHDTLGNVVGQRSGDETAVFEYDADGELVKAVNAHAEITFSRDAMGRVLAEAIDDQALVSAYDALGQRISRTTPSGRTTTWQYDAAGRPLCLDTGDQQISFGHDAAGRETHRWLSAGTALTNEWDQLGRLTARRILNVTGPQEARTSSLRFERSWTYRADGIPASMTDATVGSCSMAADPMGRVLTVTAATWSELYAYDATGNLSRATDTRTPDSPTSGPREVAGTLLKQAGRTSYEYDDQGRLVKAARRTLSGGRKTWTYRYDAHDRLTGAEGPDGRQWRYLYDPLGRRVAKQCIGAEGEVLEETRFTWDGAVLAEQAHARAGLADIILTSWDCEPGTWTPLTQERRTVYAHAPQDVVDRRFHAIVTDLVGTPTELVAPDGEVAWRRTAGLWGNALTADDADDRCPLRFPGQYHDLETGLHYNLQRYYDPQTGRYTSPDPLGLAPSTNHHAYVGNPLSWIDPLGLAKKKAGGQAAAGPEPTRIYEAGGKHGPQAVDTSRGANSKEPADGQAALDRSVQIKPTSPRRIGVDETNGEVVILDRTRQIPGPEGSPGTEIYHGHVRSWDDMSSDQGMDKARNAAVKGGLVDRKGNIIPREC